MWQSTFDHSRHLNHTLNCPLTQEFLRRDASALPHPDVDLRWLSLWTRHRPQVGYRNRRSVPFRLVSISFAALHPHGSREYQRTRDLLPVFYKQRHGSRNSWQSRQCKPHATATARTLEGSLVWDKSHLQTRSGTYGTYQLATKLTKLLSSQFHGLSTRLVAWISAECLAVAGWWWRHRTQTIYDYTSLFRF
jgi:hypothetical protein